MRVAILTLGSTGDLMPFVWLARRMQETDDVFVVSHPDYRRAAEAAGVAFVSAGPPLDLERSDPQGAQGALTRARFNCRVTCSSRGRSSAERSR